MSHDQQPFKLPEREVDICGPIFRMNLARAQKLKESGIRSPYTGLTKIENSLPGRPSMITPIIREFIPTPHFKL